MAKFAQLSITPFIYPMKSPKLKKLNRDSLSEASISQVMFPWLKADSKGIKIVGKCLDIPHLEFCGRSKKCFHFSTLQTAVMKFYYPPSA